MVKSKATSGSAALTGSNEFSRDRPLLEIKGVSKKFGDFTAVNNVDLDIYQGELFRATKIVKRKIFALLESSKLISRKI